MLAVFSYDRADRQTDRQTDIAESATHVDNRCRA